VAAARARLSVSSNAPRLVFSRRTRRAVGGPRAITRWAERVDNPAIPRRRPEAVPGGSDRKSERISHLRRAAGCPRGRDLPPGRPVERPLASCGGGVPSRPAAGGGQLPGSPARVARAAPRRSAAKGAGPLSVGRRGGRGGIRSAPAGRGRLSGVVVERDRRGAAPRGVVPGARRAAPPRGPSPAPADPDGKGRVAGELRRASSMTEPARAEPNAGTSRPSDRGSDAGARSRTRVATMKMSLFYFFG
jgi:hypothetical protein